MASAVEVTVAVVMAVVVAEAVAAADETNKERP